MSFHASLAIRHRRHLAAAIALSASLCASPAWALIVPMPPRDAAVETCPLGAQPAFAAITHSKTEAILGGTRSRLEEMRSQQVAASVEPVEASAMPAPSAGGPLPSTAPCALPALATIPNAAVQSPAMGVTAPDPWASQAAAVSILNAPQPAPALLLRPMDTSKPDVFGSVALAIGSTPLDAKWKRAFAANIGGRAGPWRGLVGEARALDQAGKIELVNRWVNSRISFADDIARFKVADRWATAAETLRAARGDCEDYAIAKMKLLEAAGVARGDMFLVIAKDLVRRADHALLVVKSGDRLVVLDNNTDRIVDAAMAQDYRPVMSYSAGKAWIHGYAAEPAPLERPQVAPVRIAALGG